MQAMIEKCARLRVCGLPALGKLLLSVGLAVGMGGAVGCASLNESNVMRGAEPIPAYQVRETRQFSGARSVTGLERTEWPAQTVTVAVNDLETGPTFGTWWQANTDPTRRSAGLYPTHASALDLADRAVDVQAQYLELFLEPVHQLLNTVLIPVFLVTKSRPGQVVDGPQRHYVRSVSVHEMGMPKSPASVEVDE